METNPHDLEWQRRYEEEDTPWDKGKPSPALADYLREQRIAGRVLVPGCGRGHDARALAAQPEATVVGLDLSPIAVAQAQKLGTTANLSFITGDFFQLPPEFAGSFDWIVEHTCFCAIDPSLRGEYVQATANALRPGGRIFGIFFMNPDSDTAPPYPSTREELSALFDPHFTLLDEWVPQNSFPGREQRELVRLLQKRQFAQ
jgi:SAM-dependent methyltransferase